jgi:very-short-patch-repair endonuclease
VASDDFSNLQSAIERLDLHPPIGYATGELKPLHSFLPALFDKWVLEGSIADVCESPIEVELGVQFLIAFRAIGNDDFELVPQQVLGSFRYDFAITRQGKLICLIECDGKEFHSTAEQIANDRAKDTLAAQMGVRMFRFSGSDIWRDPKGCAREVLHTIIFKIHLTPDQWDALNLALAPRLTAPNEFLCAAAA